MNYQLQKQGFNMGNVQNLVSVKMIADRLMRNPLLKDLNYEFTVDHAMQVLRILKAPSLFTTKREELNVENYRALKPIDMNSIMGIVRTDTGVALPIIPSEDLMHDFYGAGNNMPNRIDGTYSLNSKFINLNFQKGKIQVIYKAIATDEECYPLVLDNEVLLRCIESYIKYKWFDILNDMDMVSDRKLNKAEIDYSFNVAQADANLKMPSVDEMESLVNMVTQLMPSGTEHASRFEFLGAQERRRVHN